MRGITKAFLVARCIRLTGMCLLVIPAKAGIQCLLHPPARKSRPFAFAPSFALSSLLCQRRVGEDLLLLGFARVLHEGQRLPPAAHAGHFLLLAQESVWIPFGQK